MTNDVRPAEYWQAERALIHAELNKAGALNCDNIMLRIEDLACRAEKAEAEVERLKTERAGDQQRLFHLEGALTSPPAPSDWQQRIAVMEEAIRAADTYTHEALAAVREPRWIDERTVDLRPIHDALQACAALRTAVDAGQNAKDALPPSSSAQPTYSEEVIAMAWLAGGSESSDKMLRLCRNIAAKRDGDAIPPVSEASPAPSKLSVLDQETGSDEGMTPLCEYDAKRVFGAES